MIKETGDVVPAMRRMMRKGLAMSQFKNVTVVREANIYFDGKVTSRTILFADGSKKTLGVMLPGEYEFSTSDKEIMEIFSGDLEVLLPGESVWKTIKGGESFEVASNSRFKLKVRTLSDYCCSFIKL
jgi:purine/pyrimidine-nucleoside phosphorylase